MNSATLLEEIKSKIDIVEFISDYVPLKKSGQNYKGLCPFHAEKTPSFVVSPSKQIFHCFGCGTGGDAVSFLIKHENLSFAEAIRYLAKKAGIHITQKKYDHKTASTREKILTINKEAMRFFTKNLEKSKTASAYLKNRGISADSAKTFHLGYATNHRDALLKHMRSSGYSIPLLTDAGLIVSSVSKNDPSVHEERDWFRDRIIFPIYNLKGDIIAFGGRVLNNYTPKYINSRETEVFRKGETLFGINFSKDEIRKKGFAIIVEGYFDVILCHQNDFKTAVAPLGTALTSNHLQLLKPFSKKVILIFDGDEAGVVAAKRSLSIVFENDFQAKILLLPEGEDPDSFLGKYGASEFQKLLLKSMSAIEFFLHTSKTDPTETVREAVEMISSIHDPILADGILRELSDRSGSSESVLRSVLNKMRKKSRTKDQTSFIPAPIPPNTEEHLLLSALIAFPEKTQSVLSKIDIDALQDNTIKSIFLTFHSLEDSFTINSLLENTDDTQRKLITRLLLNPGFDTECVDKVIQDCLLALAQKNFAKRKISADTKEPDDVLLHNTLLKEKRKLIKGISS